MPFFLFPQIPIFFLIFALHRSFLYDRQMIPFSVFFSILFKLISGKALLISIPSLF
jgi:hypothetical protein